jgi:hypothetical protein
VTTFCSAVGALLSMKLHNPEIVPAEQAGTEPLGTGPLRIAAGAR